MNLLASFRALIVSVPEILFLHLWPSSSQGAILNIIIGAWAALQVTEPHSPTLASIHLRHSSFSNPSAALTTSQLILQPFRCFTYVISTSPTSQLILQPFRRFTHFTAHSTAFPLLQLRHKHFTYVTAHSPTLPPLYPRHSSFYSPSVASPTS